MKILYLYSELMGYTVAAIRVLAESGHEVHVVHWDHKKLTPYKPPNIDRVSFYRRSDFTINRMTQLAKNVEPTLTIVSGWMDKGYMAIAWQLVRDKRNVVLGLDGYWKNSLKQKVALLLGQLGVLSRFYSHAWVAGFRQYEYARRLGFSGAKIISDLYSADLRLFDKVFNCTIQQKSIRYPHRFLFVGRLESVKGLNTLLEAWQRLLPHRSDWELHVIGNGSLKECIRNTNGVTVKSFMQPEQLSEEVANAGCLILPSIDEPWGVVVHEFAAAGLPLILSDVVGAGSTFLISGLNGYTFNANNDIDLTARMSQIINTSDKQLHDMGIWSNTLSKRITPETSANTLVGIVR
jgi:glycosyltransferase involved in cell wall biosynthesis